MHELIQSEIQSDIISEKMFVTSGGSVPFREIYPTENKLPSLNRTKEVALIAFTHARYILNITHLERSLKGPRETHHRISRSAYAHALDPH